MWSLLIDEVCRVTRQGSRKAGNKKAGWHEGREVGRQETRKV
jgi:hypothetical protein